MRRLYFAVPLIGTAVFACFYLPAQKDIAAKETAQTEAKAAATREAADKQQKDLAAARAKETERRALRAAEEKKAEQKLADDHAAAVSALRAKVTAAKGEKEAAAQALENARKATETAKADRQQAQEKVFQAKKENELQRIAIRSAELNSQRLLDMLATKAGVVMAPVAGR